MSICVFSINLPIGCITLIDYLLFALQGPALLSSVALVFFPPTLLDLICHCLTVFFNLHVSVDKFVRGLYVCILASKLCWLHKMNCEAFPFSLLF